MFKWKKKREPEPEQKIYLDPQRLGVFGEEEAARSYRRLGYIILDANYRCPFGELDLVALRDNMLVFAEVRTRDAHAEITPAETVDAAKQQRLIATAKHFLRRYPEYADCDMRFDVIEVFYEGGYDCHLNRIENAFTL